MKPKSRSSLPMKKRGKVDKARDTGVTFADVAVRGSQARAVKQLLDQAKATLVSHCRFRKMRACKVEGEALEVNGKQICQ